MLGGARLSALARDPAFGTPTYVYDLDAIDAEADTLQAAFGGDEHLVTYAVKANSAAPIVRSLARRGVGADVVSGGELLFALGAGVPADHVVFSGVAKSLEEIDLALGAGGRGILAIQLESVEEIERVCARARALSLGRQARVSIRLNPGLDVDGVGTHASIATGHDEAKFGVPLPRVGEALERMGASSALSLVGLASHVGSQLRTTESYLASAGVLYGVALEALRKGIHLDYLDTGGGFGIDYGEGCPSSPSDFVVAARALARASGLGGLRHLIEPGRSLVAAHGVLLARVLQRKSDRAPSARGAAGERRWLMIDAGMNDLIRPALYQARHRVEPLERPVPPGASLFRVVGPVCESSDDFGEHPLPDEDFEHVALLDAGAYGYSMASRYNGRPLAAEVFLRGGRVVATSPRAPLSAWASERLSVSEL